MKPVAFPEATKVLGAPAGMEETCDPLHVLVSDDGSCMSVWEMDADELELLKTNDGRVCIWVLGGGGTQPPVALTVPQPWAKGDELEAQRKPSGDLAIPIAVAPGAMPRRVVEMLIAFDAASPELQAKVIQELAGG